MNKNRMLKITNNKNTILNERAAYSAYNKKQKLCLKVEKWRTVKRKKYKIERPSS